MKPSSKNFRPKFIILDLDNTLYEYEPCHSHGMNLLTDFLSSNLNLDVEFVQEGLGLARKRVKERLGHTGSSHSRIAYINDFVIQTGKQVSVSLIKQAERVYWLAYFDKMVLRKSALDFLNYAKLLNIQLYLVTDLTLNIQIEKLQKLEIESVFTLVISSEEAGGDKITDAPFRVLGEYLSPRPEFYWAIGDNCWDFPQALGQLGREFTLENILCPHAHELVNFDHLLDILRQTDEPLKSSCES